jgi:hypothetical protein
MPKLPAARSNCNFVGRIWRNNGDEKYGYEDNLWGERLESAFLVIGIFGMFRLRRRIRSDSAQHDRG